MENAVSVGARGGVRMRRLAAFLVVGALAGTLAPLRSEPADGKPEGVEPERVTVQHILIGFRASVPKKWIERSKKQAEGLAEEVLKRARAGEEFAGLVKEYTNDRFPGLYTLVNRKVDPEPGEYRRGAMVKSFGDVAFGLEIGQIGMASHHPTRSPYGWHIIKRLE
jgi:hypothetical protein